jgi:hypothetical protein
MAGDKVNTYANDDTNILALQLTTDKTFKGYHQLTLTNYDNTTVPAIAAGSAIEVNGALYKFDSEEAISTTDPVTSAAVADGTVYVCIIPGATTCTAAFTATAPTWSDSKQGWYGTGGSANYRYVEIVIIKYATSYSKDKTYSNILKKGYKTEFFYAKANGLQSPSSNADILFSNVILDTHNGYNSGTGEYFFQTPGIFLIQYLVIPTGTPASQTLTSRTVYTSGRVFVQDANPYNFGTSCSFISRSTVNTDYAKSTITYTGTFGSVSTNSYVIIKRID